MKVAKFTAAEKSASSSEQCQVHVDLFFDIQGIVHKEFVPPGKTVKDKFYCEFLKWLRESIRRKRPDKWKKNNWFLHHDNAPTNTSLVVRQFLASKNITVIPHPLFAWLRPLRLFPTPQDEITAERAPLGHDWGDPHLKTSRDAWNHGEHAGIAVYKIKGITSETVETGSYGKKLFNGQIPRIFR